MKREVGLNIHLAVYQAPFCPYLSVLLSICLSFRHSLGQNLAFLTIRVCYIQQWYELPHQIHYEYFHGFSLETWVFLTIQSKEGNKFWIIPPFLFMTTLLIFGHQSNLITLFRYYPRTSLVSCFHHSHYSHHHPPGWLDVRESGNQIPGQ